ncbi:KM727_gp14-like protein [Aratus pisonii nudivirus]|nr:KM727_gp14-like protein [Aratus pisonii nudivirus]
MSYPSKKSKQMINFNYLSCSCSALESGHRIPLKLTPERLSCVLNNYMMYLKSRNLWDCLYYQYQQEINRNINYPSTTVENFKLEYINDNNFVGLCRNNKIFKLYLCNNKFKNHIVKYIDSNCTSEFVQFVNFHVYNDDMEKDVKFSEEVVNVIKECNF